MITPGRWVPGSRHPFHQPSPTPDAARIVKATWIRLSSVTHAFNQSQRMNYLPVSAGSASSILLTAPASANLAPPGDYMLFLVDSNGVPSVAKIMRIG